MWKRLIPALLFAGLAAYFLARETLPDWWKHSDNNLFYNGHWTLGKDTGKFVFKTYGYMFDPLVNNQVDLTGGMGFQELLYKQAEDENRKLTQLNARIAMHPNGYVWFLLRRSGDRVFGCRLSRWQHFPSGFYEFDDAGELIREHSLPEDFALDHRRHWHTVSLSLKRGAWTLNVQGEDIMSVPDAAVENAQFGFRGSGAHTSQVIVREITLSFKDPASGKTWQEQEKFDAPKTSGNIMKGLAIFAVLIMLLRLCRQFILLPHIKSDRRTAYVCADWALFLVIFLVVHKYCERPEVELGNLILIPEIAALILYALFKPSRPTEGALRKFAFGIVYLLVAITLSGIAFLKHGEWLGRKMYTSEEQFARYHPNAFHLLPNTRVSGPNLNEKDLTVRMGEPWFSGDRAYREQNIHAEFTLPENTTLHLAFQQQSFQTRGDPDGEALPLQRRMIQFSTRDDVPTGLAAGKVRKPSPFYPLKNKVQAGERATLDVVSDAGGIRVTLNGETTDYPGMEVLGFGETGLMAYHNPVEVHVLDISPTSSFASRMGLSSLVGIGLPLWIGLFMWLLFRPAGKVGFIEVTVASLPALQPLLFYLCGAALMSRGDWQYLSAERLGLLDCALIAFFLQLFFPLILLRQRIKWAALYSNLILLLVITGALFLVWDRHLPDTHPLKVKFNREATAPAEKVSYDELAAETWYDSNRIIGANIYVWQHQYEGKSFPLQPDPARMRIMFIGGSQCWGSGAASTAEMFSELVEQDLVRKGHDVEVINAAINGAGIGQLYITFKEVTRHYRPDIVVADIGLNDSAATHSRPEDIPAHVESFKKTVELVKAYGGDFMLVQEPMSMEQPLRPNPGIYDGFRETAEQFDLPVLQVQDLFTEKEVAHLVWWDTAHFAPYGHQLMAKQIAPELEKLVVKRLEANGGKPRSDEPPGQP